MTSQDENDGSDDVTSIGNMTSQEKAFKDNITIVLDGQSC